MQVERYYTPSFVQVWANVLTMGVSMENTRRTENQSTLWPKYFILGSTFKENEMSIYERLILSYIYSTTIYNSEHMKTAKIPAKKGMNKEIVV